MFKLHRIPEWFKVILMILVTSLIPTSCDSDKDKEKDLYTILLGYLILNSNNSYRPDPVELPPHGVDSASRPDYISKDLPIYSALNLVPVITPGFEQVFSDIKFNAPLFLTYAPGLPENLFIVEKGGTIKRVETSGKSVASSTFLDISSQTSSSDYEEGLLGLAFSPNFETDRRFYVYYSAHNPRRSVLSRFIANADLKSADIHSEKILLQISEPYANHNGGMLAFGPDGYLYIGTGDGGGSGDPNNNAQNMESLLGKILRIDVSGSSGYSIPSDNPFTSYGGSIKKEIFALGIRNPWRFSFDKKTGKLWLGDVGQDQYEEIDIVSSGHNYGWRFKEGTHVYNFNTVVPLTSLVNPVYEYGRSMGSSITGGHVYRRNDIEDLYGHYIFGDYTKGIVYTLDTSGIKEGEITDNKVETLDEIPALVSFGEDEANHIYAVSIYGKIYKLTYETRYRYDFPYTLSETGLFEDVRHLDAIEGVVAYNVNSPLWADNLSKRRWFALPDETLIKNDSDEWIFPEKTIIIKYFGVHVKEQLYEHLETRILIKSDDGWIPGTYVWNKTLTDADLVEGGAIRTPYYSPEEGPGPHKWTIPDENDCLRCHSYTADYVLGLKTAQQNGNILVRSTGDEINQLELWNSWNYFTSPVTDTDSQDALADPYDPLGDTEKQVRSYLDTNCAFCHHPGGSGPTMDLRYTTSLDTTNMVNTTPATGDPGIQDVKIIRPGDPEKSMLYLRMGSRDSDIGYMPPLGSTVVDELFLERLRIWIEKDL